MSHLGNRVKDSLILRDVSGGRDGPPLSPGDGNNLAAEWRDNRVSAGGSKIKGKKVGGVRERDATRGAWSVAPEGAGHFGGLGPASDARGSSGELTGAV